MNSRRILSEYKELKEKPFEENIYEICFNKDSQGNYLDDDIKNISAYIYGPENTLYHGYKFKVLIALSDEYPIKPPTVIFTTKIKHVNVHENNICLDILTAKVWSPIQRVRSILVSLYVLLSEPNFESALDSDLFEIHRENKTKYEQHILSHCKAHAEKIEK
jgi:ubiquitin-protein ligase